MARTPSLTPKNLRYYKVDSSHNKSSLKIYLRLLKSVKPYRLIFALGILATLLSSGTDAVIAWAVKPLVDQGLIGRQAMFLAWLPVGILVIFTLRGIANFYSTYYINRVGRSIVMDFRQEVFAHLLQLPASFYDQNSSGKLLSLIIYNIEQLASACTDALLTVMQQSTLAIGLIVVMFVVSWHLSVTFIVVAPVVVLILYFNTRRLRRLSLSVQKAVGEVTHIARESIEGLRVIRTFGGEHYEIGKFNDATKVNRDRALKVYVANALGTVSVQLVMAIPIAGIAYLMHASILQISVGSFGAFILAVLRLLTPLRRLTSVNNSIQKGIAGAHTVFELLDRPKEKNTGSKSLDRARGRIEFSDVVFGYLPAHEPVLRNVSFVAEPGQILALVGHSGAGKSTLVHLLPRFYDVAQGVISIDDNNVHEYKLEDLRRQFAFVSQHITLFNDTIANNIAYGKFKVATHDEIMHAAEVAHLLPVIEKMPDGLNTLVGENGLTLSGGQRQRLAIARAVLKDAPILILDEATSALDTQIERQLQYALEQLMSNRTTVVIAHRLSTVERANRILVLDRGQIVEHGTHRELLDQDGYYAKLYKMQFTE